MSSDSVLSQQHRIRELIASNLCDTKIVGELEDNVKFQIQNGSYDAEANRELLKLYAVSPDMIKIEVLSRLLLKSLMELPSPEFFTSMYLVHESLHSQEGIKFLLKLQQYLETCQFKKFWKECEQFKGNAANAAIINFAEVKGFDAAIRRFISLTISSIYSSITAAQLKELWNLTDKKAFDELVSENGWSLSDDGKSVVIRAAGAPAPTSSHKEGKEPRAEYPSMEALAKMIATSL